MVDFERLLLSLTDIPSLSGFEKLTFERVSSLVAEHFDFAEQDSVGNVLLCKRSAHKHAPALMLDAHLDEIGFTVSEVHENFVRVVPSGGLDPIIFENMEVTVHGKEESPGVLFTRGEKKDRKMYVMTGLGAESAADAIRVGDAVTFRCDITSLRGRRLVGHAFDDRACAAALICAAASVSAEELMFDLTVVLSSREEVGGGGAAVAAERIAPVAAVITDVNFATAPGVSASESGPLGGGAMVSLSAVTDRRLTEILIGLAEENNLPLTTVVESDNTGTNATQVYAAGIPCAVLSLPLAGMHSASECMSLDDADAFIGIVRALLTSKKSADELAGLIQ